MNVDQIDVYNSDVFQFLTDLEIKLEKIKKKVNYRFNVNSAELLDLIMRDQEAITVQKLRTKCLRINRSLPDVNIFLQFGSFF